METRPTCQWALGQDYLAFDWGYMYDQSRDNWWLEVKDALLSLQKQLKTAGYEADQWRLICDFS